MCTHDAQGTQRLRGSAFISGNARMSNMLHFLRSKICQNILISAAFMYIETLDGYDCGNELFKFWLLGTCYN